MALLLPEILHPELQRNLHTIQMNARVVNPCIWKEHPRYRAVLRQDMEVDLGRGFLGDHYFFAGKFMIASLNGDLLTIKEGYASDLCSPAFKLGGRWYGSPTGKCEADAAFTHDCLRQILCSRVKCCPWNRKTTDLIFLELLQSRKSKLARIYFTVVACFLGTLYMALTSRDSGVRCGEG